MSAADPGPARPKEREPVTARFRVGGKVPLNVYDGDRPIFQAHTPEDARYYTQLLNEALEVRELRKDKERDREVMRGLLTLCEKMFGMLRQVSDLHGIEIVTLTPPDVKFGQLRYVRRTQEILGDPVIPARVRTNAAMKEGG